MKRLFCLLSLVFVCLSASAQISLSPKSSIMKSGQQMQFQASSLVGQWTACSGTITQTGLYTAPQVDQTTGSCVAAVSADFSSVAVSFLDITPTSLSSVNGPAAYQWAYTGTAAIPTPATAPFSATDPAGTIKADSTLSPNAHIVRLTDAMTGCSVWANNTTGPGSFYSTASGGDEDVNTNSTETLVQTRCSGGTSYVVGLNPKTLQVLGHSDKLCGGAFTFSQVRDNVAYCRPGSGRVVTVDGVSVKANGMSVYSLTFPYNTSLNCGETSCPDSSQKPIWRLVVDFAAVCAAAPTTGPKWSSIVSVENGDTVFSEAFSWVGGQDTGHLLFAYTPGVGCQTVDTAGNGVSPLWYSSVNAAPQVMVSGTTGAPLQMSFSTIHDSTANPNWIAIPHEACTGVDCGQAGHGPVLWKSGTNVMYSTAAMKQFSGHHSLGLSYFYNDNWSTVSHPFANLGGADYIVGWNQTQGCAGCADDHFQADRLNDDNPIVGANGGSGSEVYAMLTTTPPLPSNGTLFNGGNPKYRFVKTYSSGVVPQNNFWAQYSIGAPGQRRTIFCWASDMLSQLGQVAANGGTTVNRSDEFCTGLAGQ